MRGTTMQSATEHTPLPVPPLGWLARAGGKGALAKAARVVPGGCVGGFFLAISLLGQGPTGEIPLSDHTKFRNFGRPPVRSRQFSTQFWAYSMAVLTPEQIASF
jgi:hypothetical protein